MGGHTAAIYSLAFSEESSLLVSGGADWTVRCWDVKSPGGPRAKQRDNTSTQATAGEISAVKVVTGEDNAPET
jgi:transcription initiation factor TFIID subunit 5